jgi:hypothetical protein
MSDTFATKPADDTRDAAFTVPAEPLAAIEKRLADYVDVMSGYMGGSDVGQLADRVMGLAAGYLFTERQVTLARRKARVARMLDLFRQMDGALDVVSESRLDDPGFFFSPVVRTVVDAMRAVISARDELAAVRAQLGPADKSDGKRVENPIRWFIVAAELLWMEQTGTRADTSNAGGDYRAWLSLLFEIVTGEPGRSFDKALRNL